MSTEERYEGYREFASDIIEAAEQKFDVWTFFEVKKMINEILEDRIGEGLDAYDESNGEEINADNLS